MLQYNNSNMIQSEVRLITKSRADYMKKRREGKKSFSVLIDVKRAMAIETKLNEEGKTKTAWLEEKIDEDTKK